MDDIDDDRKWRKIVDLLKFNAPTLLKISNETMSITCLINSILLIYA